MVHKPNISVVCNACEQELNDHQHIARQLRTQYAEGIHRHKYYTVTLKSRLRVTEGLETEPMDRSYTT